LIEYDIGPTQQESKSLYDELSRYDDYFAFDKTEQEDFYTIDKDYVNKGYVNDDSKKCGFYYAKLREWGDQVFNQNDIFANFSNFEDSERYTNSKNSSENNNSSQEFLHYQSKSSYSIFKELSKQLDIELNKKSDRSNKKYTTAAKSKSKENNHLSKNQSDSESQNKVMDKIRTWWKFDIKCINDLLILPKMSFENYTINNVLQDLDKDNSYKMVCFIAGNDGC